MGDERKKALLYTSLGNLYKILEKYEESKLWHNKAIEYGEKHNDLSILSSAYNNIANTFGYEEKYEEAIDLYKKTLEISAKLGDKWSTALTLQNMGVIYYNLEKYQLAFEYLNQAINIYEELNEPSNILICLRFQAEIKYRWEKYDESIQLFKKAITLANKLKLPVDGNIYLGIALNKWRLGNYKDAIGYYEKAYKLFELKCSNLKISDFRLIFRKQYISVLEGLSASILNLEEGSRIENIKWALGVLEIGKARELLGHIESGGCQLCPKKEKYIAEINKLKEKQEKLIEFRDYLIDKGLEKISYLEDNEIYKVDEGDFNVDKNNLSSINKELEEIFWKIEEYQDKIWRECPSSGASVPNDPKLIINRFLKVMSEKIDEKWALIEYSHSKSLNQLYIYWMDYKGDLSVDTVKFSTKKMNSIAELSSALIQMIKEEENFDDAEEFLEKMSSLLFNLLFPIEIRSRLVDSEYEYLIIIPCDALTNIPWECILLPDGQYLGEKFCISRGFNLDLIRASIESGLKSSSTGNILIYGNPNKGEILKVSEIFGLSDFKSINDTMTRSVYNVDEWDASLEAAEEEAKTIHELIKNSDYGNSQLFTGKDATKNSFLKNLKQQKFDIFHFAGHAVFNPKDPDRSYLLFNKGERLFASEIPINACFKGKPLIVFSACESGLADTMPGDEVFGLVRGLMLAGAYDMVLSGWPVFDESTYIFMKSFYKNLLDGKTASKAIRDARIELKKEIEKGEKDLPPWKILCTAPFRYFGNPFKKFVDTRQKPEEPEIKKASDSHVDTFELFKEKEQIDQIQDFISPKIDEIQELLKYNEIKDALQLEKTGKIDDAKSKLKLILDNMIEKVHKLYDSKEYEKSALLAKDCIILAQYPLLNDLECLAELYNLYACSIDEPPVNDHEKALKYWFKSFKLFELVDNKTWQAHVLTNIAYYYQQNNDFDKESEFRILAYKLYKESNNIIWAIDELINIVKLKDQQNKFNEVIVWCEKGLEIIRTIDKNKMDKNKINKLENNTIFLLRKVADAYNFINDHNKALEYYKKGLESSTELPDILYFKRHIGNQYIRIEDYNNALKYLEDGLKDAKEFSNHLEIYWYYWSLNEYYQAINDYNTAYDINLKRLHESIELEDHQKEADTLFELAYISYNLGNHDKSIEFYEKCIDCIKKYNVDNPRLYALALSNLGGNYFTIKNFKMASEFLLKAINELDKISLQDVRINKAWALRKYGDCLYYSDKFQESVQPFVEAMELYDELGDQNNVAITALDIAESYKKLNKFEEVAKYYQIYLEIAIKIKDHYAEVHGNFEVGLAYYNLNKYFKAEKFIRRAISLYYDYKIDNQKNLAHYYFKLGQINHASRKYQESIDNFHRSLDLYEKLKIPWSISITFKIIGFVYKDMSDYLKAIDYFVKAYNLFIAHEYYDEAAICYEQIGICYSSINKKDLAIEYFHKAIENFNKAGQEHEAAYVYTKIGNTYYEIGTDYLKNDNSKYIDQFQNAINANEKCIEIMKKYGDSNKNFAISYRNIANAYAKIPNKIDDSIHNYEKSIELYLLDDDFTGAGDIYQLISELYSHYKLYDKSIDSLKKAIEFYEKSELLISIAFCYHLLSQIYSKINDYSNAIIMFNNSIEKYDSLDRRDKVALVLQDKALALIAQNKNKDALTLLNEALTILNNLNLPAHAKKCKKIIDKYFN
ncbi:MAG: tetratricopeptide repeat protein [Candidatus Helarchaeota archaeon]